VQEGLGRSVIQRISDIGAGAGNQVVIYLPQEGSGAQALDAGKADIDKALHATLGGAQAGKQDFNAASESALADVLTRKDPLSLSTSAGDRYTQLARQFIAYRDHNAQGVIQNLDQLQAAGATAPVLAALRDSFYPSTFAVVNVEIVGPKVGADLRRQAVLVTLYALGGMLIYIAFRFEWVYGAAAVLAVFHDVIITLGLFSLLGFEVSLTVIAALLTLVGYSMNDTIVIFDRIRENMRTMRREPFKAVVNRSINQTLSRTILTSGLTFLTVLVLFLMGGQVLRSFSFALVVGILIGTYSSFGIAAPLVVAYTNWRGTSSKPVSGTSGTKARGGDAPARLATAGRR
jgi:preprotein translocase subunit SecF